MKISSQSLQYVPAEVVLKDSGLTVNVSGDTVQMAFPAAESPASSWNNASWETDATASPTRYIARCLVGPGGTVTLSAGVYDVWVKINHSPEVPVIQAVTSSGRLMKLEVTQ